MSEMGSRPGVERKRLCSPRTPRSSWLSCSTHPGPRYTVLTGTPPFAAAPLSEMYQNIRDGHYLEPTQLSPSARSLIARLLAPDPDERPSLDHLLQDDFFSQVRRGFAGRAPGDLGFIPIQG